jgi:hypothetical protein
MSIKKQEFYEGAALYLLVRTGYITSIRYEIPFFIVNEKLTILLKYSTRVRSPWGFTFTPDEQNNLQNKAAENALIIGFICGSDGVASLPFKDFLSIATPRNSSIHIACYRGHGEYFDVSGPDGKLNRKVSPSCWQRVLNSEGE